MEAATSIEGPSEGGMGLFLMAQVTDEVNYGSAPGHGGEDGVHWVELVKRLAPSDETDEVE